MAVSTRRHAMAVGEVVTAGDMDAMRAKWGRRERPPAPIRQDPETRRIRHRFISVDDHLLEPPTTFAGRMPARLAEIGPRVERGEDGGDYWVFEERRIPITGTDAEMSWERTEWYRGPVAFDEVRPGMWDIHERVRDMDIGGMAASLNFPSSPFGFAGQEFSRMKDQELGLASVRAYNSWVIEEWAGPYPDRIIPNQVPWLNDPEVAAAEIYKNADLGFKCVSFTENPSMLGLPTLWEDHWDPFFRACEETETVVNLHVGSSSHTIKPSVNSPSEVYGPLFGVNGMASTLEYLFAKVPVRFPTIKFAISEGGIGWVPYMLDRIRYDMTVKRMQPGGFGDAWGITDMTPVDVVRRNFWFCTFYDPSAFKYHRYDIGVDNIMLECDYPHPDSTWPDAQNLMDLTLADLSFEEAEAVAWGNASRLYRHPLPDPD
jgi:predicted TIM-barrel fold metal-dependent hydrolase